MWTLSRTYFLVVVSDWCTEDVLAQVRLSEVCGASGGRTCYGMVIHFVWAKCEEGSNVGWVGGCGCMWVYVGVGARVGVCGWVGVHVYAFLHMYCTHTYMCARVYECTYIRGALFQG